MVFNLSTSLLLYLKPMEDWKGLGANMISDIEFLTNQKPVMLFNRFFFDDFSVTEGNF